MICSYNRYLLLGDNDESVFSVIGRIAIFVGKLQCCYIVYQFK